MQDFIKKQSEPVGKKIIDTLGKGDHFGEIALLSNWQRTCTVSSIGYSLFLTLDKTSFRTLGEEFPESTQRIHSHLKNYNDQDMEQRRMFVLNIPYFSQINDDDLINRIVLLMRFQEYQSGSIIMNRTLPKRSVMIIWQGQVQVRV